MDELCSHQGDNNSTFTPLCFVTINANGLRCDLKRPALIHWLHNITPSPDIICLQETHATSAKELSDWLETSDYSAVSSPGSAKSCGVAILYKPTLSLEDSSDDPSGRFCTATFTYQSNSFSVASIYAPNRNPDRNSFLEELSVELPQLNPIFLAGDFNTVFDSSLDRRGGSSSTQHLRGSTDTLNELFNKCDCTDLWRNIHPNVKSFSWNRPDGRFSSRIDLFGCPSHLVRLAKSSTITSCPYSDHDAVVSVVGLTYSDIPTGKSFWKLNTSILCDQDYLEMVEDFWRQWRSRASDYGSRLLWWDHGKTHIRALTVKYSTNKRKEQRARRTDLETRASSLKALADSGDGAASSSLKEVLEGIKLLDRSEASGLRVRSRIQVAEEDEQSSKFFFKSIQDQRKRSLITSLFSSADSLETESDRILETFSVFYKTLFSREETDPLIQGQFLSNLEKQLDPLDRASCEGPLSVEECFTALKGMARGKTPGLDGLPMEFYLTFWHVIGKDLVDSLNHSWLVKSLSRSQRRGVITLVPKKGDLRLCKNWRPISLLSVDYKIASRAIAGRLLRVLSSVLEVDQTACVPGRFIGDNIFLLQSICDYASLKGIPTALISLDQEKAFDRVDWGYLLHVLHSMGFGPSFIKWVSLFYTNVESCIQANGFLSDFFSLTRGVRQGCPLSPLLYILSMEPLACSLRCHPSVVGFTLPDPSDKVSVLSQYADDTTLTLCSDEAIHAAFSVYRDFEKASGAKLNQEKSRGLFLGPWAHRSDPPVELLWSSDSIKSLGISLGPNIQPSQNWEGRLTSLGNVLDLWQQRCLSFQGKALVCNSLALSGLWYTATTVPLPAELILKATRLIFNFFWSGKRELVNRKTVHLPKSRGGFGLVDISTKVSALLIQWVRRFYSSPGKWASFFEFYCLQSFGVSAHDVFSSPSSFAASALPGIFGRILSAWTLIGGKAVGPGEVGVFDSSSSPIPVKSTSTKQCSNILIERSVFPLKCAEHFYPLFRGLYWSETWSQLHCMPLDRHCIDVVWKICHGVIYTADRLSRFGMGVDPLCFCGERETLLHLFFHCPFITQLLHWIQAWYIKTVPFSPRLECRHVLFGFDAEERKVVPPVFSYVLNLLKHQVWLARNDWRFRQVKPDCVKVFNTLQARLRFFLFIFARRFRSDKRKRFFRRAWNSLGKFSPNIELATS